MKSYTLLPIHAHQPWPSFLLSVIAFSCILLGMIQPGHAFTMKAALPLYVYPSYGEADWTAATNAGGSQVSFIVANVNNGPGATPNPDWTAVINNSAANGIAVYGYVYSQYGNRVGAAVDADVSAWFQLYPKISGIFIDEAASSAVLIPYYQARYNFIKGLSPANQVVINPGTVTDEGYMSVCDVNTIFEGLSDSWSIAMFPTWVSNYAENRFFAIVYGVLAQSDMQAAVSTAKTRNFGNVFVTDALTASAPLPFYFSAELSAILAQDPVVSSPPPVISSDSVSNVTSTSAIVHWTTAASSVGSVQYNTASINFAPASDNAVATNHSVLLTGLPRKTTIFYQIVAHSPDGTATTVSPVYSFRTRP